MKESMQYIIPVIFNVARYFIIAGIPFLLFYLIFPDKFSKSKIQSQFAKQKDFVREILHSVQTTLITTVVGFILLQTSFGSYTQLYLEASAYPIWWIPVSVGIALIFHDTYFYWMHRTVHHPKLYKTIHLLHHKSINPSPWASYSFHFTEGVLEAMIAPIILFIIPMHPIALVLFTTISFMINVYGHLGFEVAPKWFRKSFLFELLNTSVHHNLHHKKFNGNYGLYFRVWDRLLKTEYPTYVEEYDKVQLKRFGHEPVKRPIITNFTYNIYNKLVKHS